MGAQMDVRATILKTGEQRIYPEKVFEAICDDPDNPLKFEEYVEIPKDGMPSITIQQSAPPPEIHSQLLIEALLKERQSKQILEDRIKELEALQTEPEKKKVGRPTKETVTA